MDDMDDMDDVDDVDDWRHGRRGRRGLDGPAAWVLLRTHPCRPGSTLLYLPE